LTFTEAIPCTVVRSIEPKRLKAGRLLALARG